MAVYKISRNKDALLLAGHLITHHGATGFIDEDGTLVLEYSNGTDRWFFVYQHLSVRQADVCHTDHGDYVFDAPVELRIKLSPVAFAAPCCGYWVSVQDSVFPVELKNLLYPLLEDAPSDKMFELSDWHEKCHRLRFKCVGLVPYRAPFVGIEMLYIRKKAIRRMLSAETYTELALLWACQTFRKETVAALEEFRLKILDKVFCEASYIPRIDAAQLKQLLRKAIAEDVATYWCNRTDTLVARVIGY